MGRIFSFLKNLLFQKSTYTRRERWVSVWLGVGAAAAVCAIVILRLFLLAPDHPNFLEKVENAVYERWDHQRYDAAMQPGAPPVFSPAAARRIAVVEIDAQTTHGHPELTTWPIPRRFHADLIRRLEEAGVKAIAFDIIFEGPSGRPQDDEALRAALADFPNVYLPVSPESGAGKAANIGQASEGRGILALPYAPFAKALNKDGDPHLFSVGDTLDDDGIIRRLPPIVVNPADGRTYLGLALRLYCAALGIPPSQVAAQSTPSVLRVGDAAIPMQEGNARLLWGIKPYDLIEQPDGGYVQTDLALSSSTFVKRVNLEEALFAPIASLREDLKDKIVIVGVTAAGGTDIKRTPMGAIPAMYAHVNFLASLFDRKFYAETNPLGECGLLLALGLLLGGLTPVLTPLTGALATAGLTWGVYSFRQSAFVNHLMVGWIGLPVFTIIATYGVVTVYHTFHHYQAKKKLSKLLQEFAPMPAPFLADALESGGTAKMGGRETELSILFSDIRGYTDLSEKLDPVTVMNTLNEYHGAMGDIFQETGGVIFDYQGDAQMVVFGLMDASKENHAAAAVDAALRMQTTLEELRHKWSAEGKHTFEVGVGICTGPVSLGVVGGAHRKQYAAIGDATNVSARLQGKSKELDAPVLIAETTFRMGKGRIIADELPPVALKGKAQPLQVYRARTVISAAEATKAAKAAPAGAPAS